MNEQIFCFKCHGTSIKDEFGYCTACGSDEWVYADEMISMVEYQCEDR